MTSIAAHPFASGGKQYKDYRGYVPSVLNGSSYLMNSSHIIDELHPGWMHQKSGDSGGIFDLTSKVYSKLIPAKIHYQYTDSNGTEIRDAELYPADLLYVIGSGYGYYPNAGTPPLSQPLLGSLIAKGATGLSRSLPTNPAFGLTRAIGEIRNDGIPAMVGMQTLKEKSHYLKNSGSEYLNAEFGWLPLISDLLSFARTVKSTNKIIRQFRHSSDAKLRRKYVFPSQSTTWAVSGVSCTMTQNFTNSFWTGAQSITSLYESSFVGAFRYHIPLGDDFSSKMVRWESEANKLLGLRLTPKVVWDLTPWTWAFGWFNNTGDVLNNISRIGADGLVVEYGYIMDKLEIVDDLAAWTRWQGKDYSASRTYTKKYMRRYPATWYGFGFDIHSLTATQDAIVVALGLSHGLR